jgi:hypothetical protein
MNLGRGGLAVVRVTSDTGATYHLAEDPDGRFWLCRDPELSVASIRRRGWEIASPRPWPPVVGERVLLCASPQFEVDDPRRLPRGARITGPIVRATVLLGELRHMTRWVAADYDAGADPEARGD